MKNLAIIFTLIFNFCLSQQTIVVTYELRPKLFEEANQITKSTFLNKNQAFQKYELINNGELSSFKESKIKNRRNNTAYYVGDTLVIKKQGEDKNITIKNFLNSNVYNKVDINRNENFIYVKSKFKNFNLELTNQVEKIDKYECNLVQGKNPLNGDQVKYWYTAQIPIQDGPCSWWVNVPGLILHIEYPMMDFYAVKIEFVNTRTKIDEFPKQTVYITETEYLKKLQHSLNIDAQDAENYQKLFKK